MKTAKRAASQRIPERVVLVRGAGAHGYFEAYGTIGDQGVSKYTRAKFYTKDGNWDLVGNNLKVFFIRDPIKFPDLVHAFKPDPVTNPSL